MPFIDFTYRNDRLMRNYVYCGPLIYTPRIFEARISSNYSLVYFLHRPAFRGVVFFSAAVVLENSAVTIEQLCDIRNRLLYFGCREHVNARPNQLPLVEKIFLLLLVVMFIKISEPEKLNCERSYGSYIC